MKDSTFNVEASFEWSCIVYTRSRAKSQQVSLRVKLRCKVYSIACLSLSSPPAPHLCSQAPSVCRRYHGSDQTLSWHEYSNDDDDDDPRQRFLSSLPKASDRGADTPKPIVAISYSSLLHTFFSHVFTHSHFWSSLSPSFARSLVKLECLIFQFRLTPAQLTPFWVIRRFRPVRVVAHYRLWVETNLKENPGGRAAICRELCYVFRGEFSLCLFGILFSERSCFIHPFICKLKIYIIHTNDICWHFFRPSVSLAYKKTLCDTYSTIGGMWELHLRTKLWKIFLL